MDRGVNITPARLALAAGAGSAALLGAAWVFEFVVGLAPCAMCYWQRWPHMAAVAIAVLATAALPGPARVAVGLAGAAAAATSGAIGAFHSGVERGWWAGPTSCTGGGAGLGSLSGADLLDVSAAAPVVMCDEIAWTFLGLSMANWNMALSFGLAALWVAAALRRPSPPAPPVSAA